MLQQAARAVTVPVRAINSDNQPTNLEGNRRWFADYDVEVLPGLGHYPMLEAPEAFNAALRSALKPEAGRTGLDAMGRPA